MYGALMGTQVMQRWEPWGLPPDHLGHRDRDKKGDYLLGDTSGMGTRMTYNFR